ncbi:DUF2523 family protein [Xenorhabdus bovienii]|uniref:DUF2523 family protein n=1 Tax=Xenorhabdus bovienii TaxID=40576 RepID=UPI0023B2A461|nr:DUF2523 family protein [Xenorhabdus bovienii]MDE9460835.1 DUF2523 domain-containing protein [Xenorhabdus bovienii]MDE9468121.1 DUF2523 domain-containing protein [Xenorhabdus bovienii]
MGRLLKILFSEGLGFIFKGIVAKFFLFSALFYMTTEFIPIIIDWFLPKSTNLAELFGALPDSVWYFFNLFQFPIGIPLMLSAMVTRFIIRRLPIIG